MREPENKDLPPINAWQIKRNNQQAEYDVSEWYGDHQDALGGHDADDDNISKGAQQHPVAGNGFPEMLSFTHEIYIGLASED